MLNSVYMKHEQQLTDMPGVSVDKPTGRPSENNSSTASPFLPAARLLPRLPAPAAPRHRRHGGVQGRGVAGRRRGARARLRLLRAAAAGSELLMRMRPAHCGSLRRAARR